MATDNKIEPTEAKELDRVTGQLLYLMDSVVTNFCSTGNDRERIMLILTFANGKTQEISLSVSTFLRFIRNKTLSVIEED